MNCIEIEAKVRAAVAPLAPADKNVAFWGNRSHAGRSLPPYYLVYFLLVQFLRFKDLGRAEKVAFSIPVEFNGKSLMVEHRKFGLGIFIKNAVDEAAAKEVAKRICAGVKAAQPYFDTLAKAAAKGSNLNVNNNACELFNRLIHFSDCYRSKLEEAESRDKERITTQISNSEGVALGIMTTFPSYQIKREAHWYAMAAIEAFYSWTEHVFILAAILKGSIATGEDVAKAAGMEWKEKFKLAIEISDPKIKYFYDQLNLLRSQVRNFVAHGAFGKNGQALNFHSSVGAVPLLLPHMKNKEQFRFGSGMDFAATEAMQLISDFIDKVWSKDFSPAKIYIDSGLPLILSYVVNGKYAQAMASEDAMTGLTEYLLYLSDSSANMDW